MNKKSATKISFLISFVYVGFATISILGLSLSSPIHWSLSHYGVLITFPVSIIGFGVAYTVADNLLIIVTQFAMFLICWYLVYLYMKKNMTSFDKI